MAAIIRAHPEGALASRGDAFYTLARSIAGQQISVKAADSVWAKLEALHPVLTPHALLTSEEAALRACGLSGQKINYLKHISEVFHHEPERVQSWHTLPDDALIAELTRLKGVGRWTAEMMLIFHYLRPDVLPLGDIGVLKAIEKHYGIPRERAHELSARWQPWRTVATWYLWRALDPVPVAY